MNKTEWKCEGRGGVFFGDFYATWPFASLRVGTDRVEITVRAAKFFTGLRGVMTTYTFHKSDLLSLRKRFSLFGAGLQLEHSKADYPKKFIISGSKRMIAAIETAMSSMTDKKEIANQAIEAIGNR